MLTPTLGMLFKTLGGKAHIYAELRQFFVVLSAGCMFQILRAHHLNSCYQQKGWLSQKSEFIQDLNTVGIQTP